MFPEDTEIKVTRDGDRLMAPGIGEDSLGLASILGWVRALEQNDIATWQPILFAGLSVGLAVILAQTQPMNSLGED